MKKKPILILDSGIGGLYITQFLLVQDLKTSIIYYSDFLNFPYGKKNGKEIFKILKENIEYLLNIYNMRKIILACNSASLHSIVTLRRQFPFLNIFPVLPPFKKAINISKNKSILFVGTKASVKAIFKGKEICSNVQYEKNNPHKIYSFVFDVMVKHIESKLFDIEGLKNLLQNHLISYLNRNPNIDVIILGCTHFYYIQSILKQMLNEQYKDIKILESGEEFITKLKKINKIPFKKNELLRRRKIYTNRIDDVRDILKQQFQLENIDYHQIKK